MEAHTINPEEFRSTQRDQWNTAADGWRKWTELIEHAGAQLSARLVEMAGISEGHRVLDVAAGYGEPALTAAKRVGPGGSVVATDISAAMLAFGAERARAAGVSNVEFVESEASALDFAPGSFDAALSRFGIIFEPDAEGAAAKVRGFLAEGGRMAIASWGPADRVPLLGVAMGIAMQKLALPPPPPGTPGPLSRPSEEALGGLLESGGFSDIRTEDFEYVVEPDSAEQFVTFLKEIAPPLRALIDPQPPEVREEVWDAIAEGYRALEKDGQLRMSNQALLASGAA